MTESLPKPPISLAALAEILPDAVVMGDGSLLVSDIVHPLFLQQAISTGAKPAQLMPLILDPKALAVLELGVLQVALVPEEMPIPEGKLAGYLKVKRPKHALAYLLNIFNKPPHYPNGVHPTAIVHSSATVHPSVKIGAFSVIHENAKVGEGTILMSQVTIEADAVVGKNNLFYAGARIGERVLIGDNVIVHYNAVIGADGFSFVTPQEGSVEAAKSGNSGTVTAQNTDIIRINSVGNVIIEDNVEIGACTCIDRSTLGATLVKRNTKIDNLVQIGHNNTIGENCLIVSQAGIAGSCKIGDRVVIAGQVGLADHLKVGDDAIITAKAGVMRDVEPKSVIGGNPAFPIKEAMLSVAMVHKLPEMRRELKDLKKRLAELEGQLSSQKEKATV